MSKAGEGSPCPPAMPSRPLTDFAEPPAESPSTMKISAFSGSRLLQSTSLPGRDARTGVFRLASSRALQRKQGRRILMGRDRRTRTKGTLRHL